MTMKKLKSTAEHTIYEKRSGRYAVKDKRKHWVRGDDKVAVKPHASPVYHAIKYLTGELDRSYLTRLRDLGGLQAYPSRTKDPDVADFSTGSVGLGAVAPLFASMARRYIDAHTAPAVGSLSAPAPEVRPARFIALVGDAELLSGAGNRGGSREAPGRQ